MNLLTLSLILMTAIPSAESADGERWKPFDHPAVVERTFTAFTQPGDTLSLISGAMGFFKVDEVVFGEGDRIPGRDGEWVPAIRVDSSIDIAQKKSLEIRLELAQSATEAARLASVRADSVARLATTLARLAQAEQTVSGRSSLHRADGLPAYGNVEALYAPQCG